MGTGSMSSTGGSATTTTGAHVTSTAGATILGLLKDQSAARNNTKRGVSGVIALDKRQATGGFIGGAGPVNPESCSAATSFDLLNGQLLSGGVAIATDPGVAYIPIKAVPGGSISTTFALVDNVLHWYNDAFTGGEAGTCQDSTGQIFFTFKDSIAWPSGCTHVSITACAGKSLYFSFPLKCTT
jgi:hypothetical protein